MLQSGVLHHILSYNLDASNALVCKIFHKCILSLMDQEGSVLQKDKVIQELVNLDGLKGRIALRNTLITIQSIGYGFWEKKLMEFSYGKYSFFSERIIRLFRKVLLLHFGSEANRYIKEEATIFKCYLYRGWTVLRIWDRWPFIKNNTIVSRFRNELASLSSKKARIKGGSKFLAYIKQKENLSIHAIDYIDSLVSFSNSIEKLESTDYYNAILYYSIVRVKRTQESSYYYITIIRDLMSMHEAFKSVTPKISSLQKDLNK